MATRSSFDDNFDKNILLVLYNKTAKKFTKKQVFFVTRTIMLQIDASEK